MNASYTTESCKVQQLIVGIEALTLQPMVVTTKQTVRDDFASRLEVCLMDHQLAPKDRGRAAWLARFMGVSGEMARKWLAGEALPNQARMAVIADKFGIRVAWLRDGEGPMHTDNGELDKLVANRIAERSVTAYGVTVTESGLLFAAEVEKLPPENRKIVEDLVGLMVGKQKRDERPKTSVTPSKSAPKPSGPAQPRIRTNQ